VKNIVRPWISTLSRARILLTIVYTGVAALSIECAWKILSAEKKGGRRVQIPDEYLCDQCGCLFLLPNPGNVFCPNCGGSQVRKEKGYNELSDEDVYVGMDHSTQKTDVIW
jgi:hypothetical protein